MRYLQDPNSGNSRLFLDSGRPVDPNDGLGPPESFILPPQKAPGLLTHVLLMGATLVLCGIIGLVVALIREVADSDAMLTALRVYFNMRYFLMAQAVVVAVAYMAARRRIDVSWKPRSKKLLRVAVVLAIVIGLTAPDSPVWWIVRWLTYLGLYGYLAVLALYLFALRRYGVGLKPRNRNLLTIAVLFVMFVSLIMIPDSAFWKFVRWFSHYRP